MKINTRETLIQWLFVKTNACENFWKVIRESYLDSWHSTQTLWSILLFEKRTWTLSKILRLYLVMILSNVFLWFPTTKNTCNISLSCVFWRKQIIAKSLKILHSWKQIIEQYPIFLFVKTNASELCFELAHTLILISNAKVVHVWITELVNMKKHHYLYSKTISSGKT